MLVNVYVRVPVLLRFNEYSERLETSDLPLFGDSINILKSKQSLRYLLFKCPESNIIQLSGPLAASCPALEYPGSILIIITSNINNF